jgi:penicillin-binding protein 1A
MAKRRRYLKTYRKSKKKKRLFFISKLLISFSFLFVLSLLFIFLYYAKDLPRPERFLEKRTFQSTKIYDRTGEVLLYTIHGEEKREIISLDQISPFLKQAVIAVEDTKFYEHRGIDLTGILRSILVDLRLKRPAQGGSTITQQLIRSSFLTLEKTLERKVREIILSLELERKYSKDQILEWYLNQVPFGSNSYGIEAASQTFFQKPARDLSLAEAATLASLIRAPSYLSPYGENKNELLERKDRILGLMVNSGFITKEQSEKAKNETLNFAEVLEPIKAPHFVLYVKNYLIEEYGEDFLKEKGFKVYTSLDWELQEAAEEIVAQRVKTNKDSNAHNASLVAIDPNNGEVLTLVGSADWFGDPYPEGCTPGKDCLFDPKFNIAIGTKSYPGRQPGSAFKPFAYAAAFKKGFTPETILWDAKTEFNLNCSSNATQTEDEYGLKCYHPQNYDDKFRGPISMRDSLAQSINLTSVKTLYLAGVEETINLAKNLGITTLTAAPSQYGLSLVLGGGEVKLLEMASAYGVFATEGFIVPSVSILKIEDSEGATIEKNKKTPKRVLEAQVCRLISDVLSDNEARIPMFGPISPLYFEGQQVAVKTGTTQEYRDAWTVGFTSSIVAGVWVGNNDNSPTGRKPGVALASPLWHQFMEKALLKYPKQGFENPEPTKTSKSVLNGEIGESYHSILHYVKKDDPQGEIPASSSQGRQYEYWEKGIEDWLFSHPEF